ncbi:MAG: ABC transporter substrate-binding protein [Bdellovibrionota bacterium]
MLRLIRYFKLMTLPYFFLIFSFSAIATESKSFPKVISVGVATTLLEFESNSSITAGDFVRRGINVALRHYDKRLQEKNIRIALKEFDYANSDLAALEAAKRAAASDVIVVHGYDFSSHALVAAPIHQKTGLPLLSPTATADRLTNFGPYIHQVAFNNSYQAKMLARYAVKNLGVKRCLVVAAKDCAYCQDLEKSFSREFKKLGGETVKLSPILQSDQDFAPLVAEAKVKNIDAVFLPNYEVLSARIVSAFLSAGIRKPFIGGDGWTSFGERIFKSAMAERDFKAYSIGHWHLTSLLPASQRLVKDFQAIYKTQANDTAALAYDTMCIILEAVLRAKTYTRESIERELRQLKTFHGATGKIQLGTQSARSLYLLHMNKNGFSLVEDLSERYAW